MRASSVLALAVLTAGCGQPLSEASGREDTILNPTSLSGDLPAQVFLTCASKRGRIDYRVYFDKAIWDSKGAVGGWSSYSSIASISANEIFLLDHRENISNSVASETLQLDRTNLRMKYARYASGVMPESYEDDDPCEIASRDVS